MFEHEIGQPIMANSEHAEMARRIVDDTGLDPETPDLVDNVLDNIPREIDGSLREKSLDIAICGEVVYSVHEEPEAIAGSAVYMSCLLQNKKITQQEAADATNFSATLIGENYRKIKSYMAVGGEEKDLPPLFEDLSSATPIEQEEDGEKEHAESTADSQKEVGTTETPQVIFLSQLSPLQAAICLCILIVMGIYAMATNQWLIAMGSSMAAIPYFLPPKR